MTRRAAILAMLALSLSACASMRSIKVESDDATSHTIYVRNTRSSSIQVSYSDGTGGTRDLGTVSAGRTERFVVVSSSGRITLFARSSTGANLPSQSVSLTGEPTVTIR